MAKVYIYRIVNHNGRKEYKRTKCTYHWSENKSACWQFTKQAAKQIVNAFEVHSHGYYSYGIEPVE